jgi:hypothetical protein
MCPYTYKMKKYCNGKEKKLMKYKDRIGLWVYLCIISSFCTYFTSSFSSYITDKTTDPCNLYVQYSLQSLHVTVCYPSGNRYGSETCVILHRGVSTQRQDSSIPAHAWLKLVLVTFHPLSKAKETFLTVKKIFL